MAELLEFVRFTSRIRAIDHQVSEKAGELLAGARQAGKTVPLGDGLHAAVAELEDLTVATVDVERIFQVTLCKLLICNARKNAVQRRQDMYRARKLPGLRRRQR